MKKIIGVAAAGLVLTGAAFADVSFSAQARILADAFSYETPSRSEHNGDGEGIDDNGTVTWAKDVTHNDDVTLNASTDNAGAKIVFSVKSYVMGMNGASTETDGTIELTSYQLWMNLGKVRIDAGAYDQRLGRNLSTFEGNWKDNYFSSNKPGIWVKFDSEKNGWGLDSTNLTTIDKDKKRTNFQVSTALNDQLTLRGALFLTTAGTLANNNSATENNKSRPWIFTPFALGAEYKLDKNSKLGVVGKLNYIAQGDTTTPQKSVWTLAADYYNKLNSNLEIEAAYTFGTVVYTNNGHDGAHWDGNGTSRNNANRLVRDNDVFAHGFDFRFVDKLNSQLSVGGVFNVSYVQSTEVLRHKNRATGKGTTYKDALAKSYTAYDKSGKKIADTGAAGQLYYYAALTANYAASDTVTYQVQTRLEDNNLFEAVQGDSSKYHVDYLYGMKLNIRPAILLNVDKSQFYAGFDFGIKGFQTSASGKNNTVYTTYKIPIGLRFKM